MSESSQQNSFNSEGPWSKFVAVIFLIGLVVCVLAGFALVILQAAALAFGSSALSVTAEAVFAPLSAIGASAVCIASLGYYWCRRRTINV